MNQPTSSAPRHQVWWAVIAVLTAMVMALKPMGTLTDPEWKWTLGGLGALMLTRVLWMLRSASTSPGRILLLLMGIALACSMAVIGVPAHWFRVPALSEVTSVVFPVVLGMAAIVAALIGLAGWNRHRDLDGAPQRSYLPIALNIVIVAAVWHVVRQPLWKESLQGMMKLPQLRSNRMALEASLEPWMEIIQHGDRPAATPEPGTSRKAVASTHALGQPGPKTAPATPAEPAAAPPAGSNRTLAEQWIQAAVHNQENPALELRAAVALVAADRSDQALGRLASARKRGCQSPELIRFHARLLRARGRPAGAGAVLEALVLSPEGTDQDLRECLGSWEQAGQPARAENLAERLLVRRPSRELSRWLAAHDAAEGRYERALVLLAQLSRRAPFDPADAYQLAEVALSAGRPELTLDAVSMLTQAGHGSARSAQLAERARNTAMAGSARVQGADTPARPVRGG